MKQFGVILAAMLFAISSAFADGTKQLMPNSGDETTPTPQGICYITIAAQEGGSAPSRPFARYSKKDKSGNDHKTAVGETDNCSCAPEHRIHIHIADSSTEKIYFGFGAQTGGSRNLKFRVKDPSGVIVYAETTVPTSGGQNTEGWISEYKHAYWGPQTLKGNSSTHGYKPFSVTPERNGDYWIEFYNGSNIGEGSNAISIKLFDVTVAKDNGSGYEAIDGRVWSRAWGLSTEGESNQAWSTFYTRSTDKYISKVYLAGVRPYKFVFGCNHYGARNTQGLTGDEKRQSYMGQNTFTPEYMIFLTMPDESVYDVAELPNIPENLTFAGSAMSCEDLIFAIKLLYTENVTLELFMDLDGNADNGYERIISDVLETHVLEERGLHYPWKNNPNWETAGEHWYLPDAAGCARRYKLSLFDQTYTYDGQKYNPGEKVPITLGADDFYASIGTYTVGTANNPILIKTKEDLDNISKALQSGATGKFEYTIDDFYVDNDGNKYSRTFEISAANGFNGVHFYLIAPSETITLDNEWEGIGTDANPFKGTFRCGNYIPNPVNEVEADGSAGSSTAEVAGAQNTIIFDNASIGLFYKCKNATIDNIHVKGTIISNVNDELGAICCKMENTTIKHCTSQTNITTPTTWDVGGIVGLAEGTCIIDSCANYGNITVNVNITEEVSLQPTGGIVGYIQDASRIYFCRNTGSIKAPQCGGIAGIADGIDSISSCKNEGYVHAYGKETTIVGEQKTPTGYAGGIVGLNSATTINLCRNDGTIYSKNDVAAGINNWVYVNTFWETGFLESCLNKGQINGVRTYGLAPSNTDIKYSLSSSPFELYTNTYNQTDWSSYTSFSEVIEDFNNYELKGFIFNDNGEFTIDEITCCGNIYRIEDAGRLFNDKETFYITWDGKDDDGNCVVGDVTVAYQKNSGVTHFPFYDPEYIENGELLGESAATYNMQGMVVYRITPIDPEKATAEFGYQKLPKNYYHNDGTPSINPATEEDRSRGAQDSEEYGIELKLFWDDREVHIDGACKGGEIYGTSMSTTKTERYCYRSSWNGCKEYRERKVTSSNCTGIENVSYGGYYGSGYGGHIFPANNFGDKNTMNTWWNGVEMKAIKTLKLYENEPAILMPVELDKWTATSLEESVLLEWTTASEENNDYFAIERSIDGVTWKVLGNVGGAGTTSATHYYSFEDTKPVSGISYYRLKQVDFNGEYTYSSVKCINRPANADKMYKAYVNKDIDAFIVQGEEIAACNIEVYNNLGVKMTNLSFNPISTDKVVINVGQLPIGTYFIKICNGSKSVVKSW